MLVSFISLTYAAFDMFSPLLIVSNLIGVTRLIFFDDAAAINVYNKRKACKKICIQLIIITHVPRYYLRLIIFDLNKKFSEN